MMTTNLHTMSFFLPPISPVKDETGKIRTYATLKPFKDITLKEVHRLITTHERLKTLTQAVRRAAESGDEKKYRLLKQQTLPYITPCGTFSYRSGDHLLLPSGVVVVDIDHLDSYPEAVQLRGRLFRDPYLLPCLSFISPSGRGVKIFVPYNVQRIPSAGQNAAENVYWLMNYVQTLYGNPEDPTKDKGVDTSGKDLVRACFLSHDEGALFRE